MSSRRNASGRRVRNAYFTATVSVSLVLFLLGVVGYIFLNVENSVGQILDGMRVSVILKEKLDPARLASIRTDLERRPEVTGVRYVDKNMAAAEFRSFTGEDILEFLDENPLPASYELTLSSEYGGEEALSALETAVRGVDGVDQVVYQKNVLAKLIAAAKKVRLVMAAFIAALLVVSVVLINNAVGMVLFSKKRILKTMKLVGATDAFIRRPFVLHAFTQGVTAAFIASVLLTFLVYGAGEFSADMGFSALDFRYFLMLYGFLFATGLIICFLCTVIAVKKYLHIDNDDLHVC